MQNLSGDLIKCTLHVVKHTSSNPLQTVTIGVSNCALSIRFSFSKPVGDASIVIGGGCSSFFRFATKLEMSTASSADFIIKCHLTPIIADLFNNNPAHLHKSAALAFLAVASFQLQTTAINFAVSQHIFINDESSALQHLGANANASVTVLQAKLREGARLSLVVSSCTSNNNDDFRDMLVFSSSTKSLEVASSLPHQTAFGILQSISKLFRPRQQKLVTALFILPRTTDAAAAAAAPPTSLIAAFLFALVRQALGPTSTLVRSVNVIEARHNMKQNQTERCRRVPLQPISANDAAAVVPQQQQTQPKIEASRNTTLLRSIGAATSCVLPTFSLSSQDDAGGDDVHVVATGGVRLTPVKHDQIQSIRQHLLLNDDDNTTSSSSSSSFIYQFDNKFLVCGTPSCCAIMDQHAVSERGRLEAFVANMQQSTAWCAQPVVLSRPVSIDDARIAALAQRFRSTIEHWGWRVEVADVGSSSSSSMIACPKFTLETFELLASGIEPLTEYLLLLQEKTSSSSSACSFFTSMAAAAPSSQAVVKVMPPLLERFAVTRSCRGAIMFGDTLSKSQMRGVLDAVAGAAQFDKCSHGRVSMKMLPLLPVCAAVPSFMQSSPYNQRK